MASLSAVPVKKQSSVRVFAILALVIAFGWPALLLIPGVSTHQLTSVHDDVVGICAKWFAVVLLCLIAFGIQSFKPSELGVRGLGWRDALFGTAFGVLALVASGALSQFVSMPVSLADPHKLAAVPFLVRVAVVATAAICEEFMYRAVAIEELAVLLGNRWFAALIALAVFALTHVGTYGFSSGLLVPTLVGAILTGLYLWRRNLASCAIAHAIVDGVFLLLVPALIQGK